MGGTRETAADFSGGSGGASGYRYQALAAAYVAAHALAERPLNWIAPAAGAARTDAVPAAVWSETGGPGDDLKVEFIGSPETGNGLLEVQAKRGISRGPALDVLIPMACALAGDSALRCTLLVDYDASRPVRRDLKRDIRRVAEGRTDRLKPITEEFLAHLDAKGVAADPALLGRLTIVVADFVEGFDGEAAALALLAHAVEGASVATAWTVLREDAMRLTETAGRWDVQTVWGLLESHRVRPAETGSPTWAAVTEDHVPPTPRPFIGREEAVEEIADALEGSTGGKAPVVAVFGLPGVGKTAVAAAAAEKLRLSFPDGVLWASVGPSPSPLSVLTSWGRSFGAEDLAGYSNVAAASARMRALLRDRRTLLVLDDVWDAAHANPLAVAGLRGATLTTTRSPSVARGLAPAGIVVDLELLRVPEAVRLIEDLAPSLGGEKSERLVELAERLGRLPLALRVAGGLLEEEAALGLGVEDLLSELTEGEAVLAASVPEDLRGLVGETTPTVAALLGRSTYALGETDRERFAQLGAFAPGPATFDLPAAERVWEGTGGGQARETMRTLAARGLVQADGSGRFSVHPVLALQADALLHRTDDAGYSVRLRHALHYLEVLRSAEKLYSAGGESRSLGIVLFDAEWENIRAGREWAVRSGLTAGTDAAEAPASAGGTEANDVLPATNLVLSYAEAGRRWISMRVDLPERALWAENAIEAARLLEEANRDASGARSGHRYQAARAHQLYLLAQAKFGMGDSDGALQCLEESAEIFHLLGDQRGRGRSVGLCGAIRQRKGEYGSAEEDFRAALALLDDAASALAAREYGTEADPGEDQRISRDRAMILGNFGSFLKNKGRADDAEKVIGEAIDIFRTIGDTRQAAVALDNLGALLSELRGDRKGALRAFGMAKRIFRGLGWRQDETVALLAIGRERANAGEYAVAESTAQELLALSEELGDLSLRGWALALMGSARLGLEDPAGAAKIYDEVLGLSQQTQDGRLRIMAKTGLGRAALPDNPAEALDYFEEGLVAARGIPVPLIVGQLLFGKAQALDALGHREEAIAAAEEAVVSRAELQAAEVAGVREWLAERRGPG